MGHLISEFSQLQYKLFSGLYHHTGAPPEKINQQVILATDFLIGLSDDQLQGYWPQMQRVINRTTQVTKRQLETAESIIRIANEIKKQ